MIRSESCDIFPSSKFLSDVIPKMTSLQYFTDLDDLGIHSPPNVYQCHHLFPSWAIKLVQTCPRSEVPLDHASTCMPPNFQTQDGMLKTLGQAPIDSFGKFISLQFKCHNLQIYTVKRHDSHRFTQQNRHLVTQCTEALGVMKTPDMHRKCHESKEFLHGKGSSN